MAAAGAKTSTKAKSTKTAKTTNNRAKTAPKTVKKTTPSQQKTTEGDEAKKKRLIKKEIRRLSESFKVIEPDKKRVVQATINDAAFLTVSMEYLREQIAVEGTEVEYKNGENQYGTKQSPAVQTYLAMSQKLTAAIKILLDCLPKTEAKEAEDKFDDFIVERGDD
jgi:hypothetical protein